VIEDKIELAMRFVGVDYVNGRPLVAIPGTGSLSGVIAWLTKRHNGNVYQRGLLEITSNHPLDQEALAPFVVTDFEGERRFSSDDKELPWLMYEFKEMRVEATAYELRSAQNIGPNGCHPKGWQLEGSANGKDWTLLDSQRESEALNGMGLFAKFPIAAPAGKAFRFFRLTMTQKNWFGNWWFTLSAWEIYGTLIGGSE
jgi:hypothetical protein